MSKIALLIVDLQNDFCPGGSLAVADGANIVPRVNRLIENAKKQGNLVLASLDWHPAFTRHFKDYTGIWPVHCVAGTKGAELHPGVNKDSIDYYFTKGTGNADGGYSAFEATNLDLAEYLHTKGVETIVVCGIATDYCVKATVLDAIKKGFLVTLDTTACAAVNLKPGDGDAAIKEMDAAGALIVK